MGMIIPPSIKAIIGMINSPIFLSSSHSPYAAYLTPTCRGMLYLILKLFIPSSESTKCYPFSKKFLKEILQSRNKSWREFRETYKFERWSSDKVFVFVDAQENERERERQVHYTGSKITRLLKVKRN